MSFVKLDTGILDSTLWVDRDERDVFITALLMAEPHEVTEPVEQIAADSLKHTGFVVPPGWYGFIRAAGPGIVRRALVAAQDGIAALVRLGEPDPESRTHDHDGRRLVRVDGGYLVLNFMRYRDKDNTTAERSKRYRERQKTVQSSRCVTRDGHGVTRDSSLAEAEADTERAKQKTAPDGDLFPGVEPQVVADFKRLRNKLRAPITKTAMTGIEREASKAGLSLGAALAMCCERGWRGFKADWVVDAAMSRGSPPRPMGKQEQGLRALEAMKSGNRMAAGRTGDGVPEALLLGVGTDPRG